MSRSKTPPASVIDDTTPTHSLSLSLSLLAGLYVPPLADLTWAQALEAASILRPYFEGYVREALDDAIQVAATHPGIEATDVFCDGIASLLAMPKDTRPDAVLTLRLHVQIASGF